MDEPIQTFKEKNGERVLKIYYDSDTESPREWDNLGKMLCFHKRYNLGDPHEVKSEDFDSWSEIEDYLRNDLNAIIVKPLRLYDHSGISISTTAGYPYSCPWDSGQVGFIYATREDVLENFNKKKITPKMLAMVSDVLEGEVKVYNDYLTGNVYGFNLVKPTKCKTCGHEDEEVLDSCCGFYGDDAVKSIFDSAWLKEEEWEEID